MFQKLISVLKRSFDSVLTSGGGEYHYINWNFDFVLTSRGNLDKKKNMEIWFCPHKGGEENAKLGFILGFLPQSWDCWFPSSWACCGWAHGLLYGHWPIWPDFFIPHFEAVFDQFRISKKLLLYSILYIICIHIYIWLNIKHLFIVNIQKYSDMLCTRKDTCLNIKDTLLKLNV